LAHIVASFAFTAGDSLLFGIAFFVAILLAAGFSCCALAALAAAHRFFAAAMIAFLPAAESFRLAFGLPGMAVGCGSDSPRSMSGRQSDPIF